MSGRVKKTQNNVRRVSRIDGMCREKKKKEGSKMDLKILNHGHQRNGISGEGFYYFDIEFKNDDNKKTRAIATLINDCDKQDEHPEKFNGSCRVITPDNLNCHWRGDNFEEAIRKQKDLWFK